jgi:hypothetical protein
MRSKAISGISINDERAQAMVAPQMIEMRTITADEYNIRKIVVESDGKQTPQISHFPLGGSDRHAGDLQR